VTESTVNAIVATGVGKTVEVGGRPLHILSAVSVSIQRGESIAIVGVSGSGKSTLLGLLAGLDLPSAGVIDLAGQRITDMDEDQRAEVRARHVGFVFQSFQLLPNLTALENVQLPLEILNRADAGAAAEAALQRVELDARAIHYPRQLSGGEQHARRWRARSSPRLAFCSPMSQPATSTTPPAGASPTCCLS